MDARKYLFGNRDAELGLGLEGRDLGDEGFCQCTSEIIFPQDERIFIAS